jgi:hypothetical protein
VVEKHLCDITQAPTAAGLFTSISAPSSVRSSSDFTFTVAAGVAAGGSTVKPLRLVVQVPSTGITLNSVAAPNTAGVRLVQDFQQVWFLYVHDVPVLS